MAKEEASQITENAKKLIEIGLDEEAYNLLSEVVDAFPLEPVPNMLFQYAAARSGHSAVIFERYEQLAALMPQSAAAQLLYARLLRPGERRLRIAKRAVELDGGLRVTHEVLVSTILALDLLVQERAALQKAADSFADYAVFMHAAADADAAAGDIPAALKRYEAALKLEPEVRDENSVSEIVIRLGQKRFERGDFSGARGCFEFALGHGRKDSPVVRLALANCDIKENRLEEARERIKAVISDYPGSGDAAANLALLDALSGNFDAALKGYEKALELSPRNVTARRNMARVLLELGRHADAVREARSVLDADRGNAEVYKILIEGYITLGMTAEARFMLEQFVKHRPDAAKGLAGQYNTRIAAAKAESEENTKEERGRLEKLLEDPDPEKRAGAFVKLNRLMRPAGFPHLEKLLLSRYPD
ncbi:MAG: tetratricopeptide repeat protein, partial [Planctomycetota bacterium]